MAQSNQIVKFGNGLVDAAKSVQIDPAKFINTDTTQTAIRYKKMAPIVIASRLKTMVGDCQDKEEKNKLLGYIAELETAQKYAIDEGKCELIHWSSTQSSSTVHACFGVYNLYSSNGKPVCDLVLISITQKRTIDMANVTWKWGAAAALLGLFVPFVGPLIAAGVAAMCVSSARDIIKDMTTKEQADIFMLKTLEHYGLIRLLNNNEIQLVNE